MNLHYCLTSDGMRVGCICSTGRDHSEDEMNQGPDMEPEGDVNEDEDHCGNDCGGISTNDGTGEHYDAEECVHCECCCFCTPCQYARVA